MDKKTVLITGAGGGMGRATCEWLAKNGYTVLALDKTECEKGDGIIPLVADLTDEGSVLAAFSAATEVTDGLHAIIHYAGVYMLDSLVEMDTEAFERIMKINLGGAFLVNKIFLPLLKNGSKILITTSELAVLDPLPFTGVYAVSKAALDGYAYSLRMELQLKGVSVSVLRAGAVETGMLGASTAALERFCAKTKQYAVGAERFRKIVDSVEARSVPPLKIAKKASAIIRKKRPGFAYAINRNPLLLLLNALPKRFQLWVIRRLLSKKS